MKLEKTKKQMEMEIEMNQKLLELEAEAKIAEMESRKALEQQEIRLKIEEAEISFRAAAICPMCQRCLSHLMKTKTARSKAGWNKVMRILQIASPNQKILVEK